MFAFTVIAEVFAVVGEEDDQRSVVNIQTAKLIQ